MQPGKVGEGTVQLEKYQAIRTVDLLWGHDVCQVDMLAVQHDGQMALTMSIYLQNMG